MLWSSMFKVMENIREEFTEVEDYSISQTSLEQVFISFAKMQKSTEQTDGKNVAKKQTNGAAGHKPTLHRYLSSASRTSDLQSENNAFKYENNAFQSENEK